ncbi:Alternative oxidase [Dillenia turbinata]|uniref:Ubiquinol oxidase n=1 Tax=Dillenia turbinata TaxID=194707 RepID=A0AAN8VIS9_9MAGN
MSNLATKKLSGLLLKQLGPHHLSSTSAFHTSISNATAENSKPMITGLFRTFILELRNHSTLSSDELMKPVQTSSHSAQGKSEDQKDQKAISSYWGIAPKKLTKEDGSAWRWNCFMPWDCYKADISIDVKKHHKPSNFMDKFAYWTVQTLKYPTYLFFQRRHVSHVLLLETVAAVPGMVGGMLLHCKSLRRFEHSGGWIKALLEEAENERMHLLTFIEVARPKLYERALIFAVQGMFFNAYFLTYIASPKLAHRIVGYLEEEAVNGYTEFLKDLENGTIENIPAPAIAIDYWCLSPDSTLRDVVTVVRADEAHHRDLNHYASDIQCQGLELKEAPAPLGYH